MYTARIDCLLLGYRVIEYGDSSAADLAMLLLRSGINAGMRNGKIVIRERDYAKISEKVNYPDVSVSEPQGVPSALKRLSRSYGTLVAAFIVAFIALYTSDLVWDVRVEGNEAVSAERIKEELAAAGLSVGVHWSKVNNDALEVDLLSESETLSWISINRRGTVAYVKVIEKMNGDSAIKDTGYCNVIASVDCVIEEITVKAGYPVVEVGDTVKKGDLLISGIMPDELGGGFCHAEGIVKGRVCEEISVTVPREEEKNVYSDEFLDEVSVQIFDFSINIFKKYGNLGNGCDIIKDKEDIILFGKYRLPMSVTKFYGRSITQKRVSYSDSELTKLATSRLLSKIQTALHSADLVGMRTDGKFTDNGYTMTSYLTVSRDVGTDAYFEVVE